MKTIQFKTNEQAKEAVKLCSFLMTLLNPKTAIKVNEEFGQKVSRMIKEPPFQLVDNDIVYREDDIDILFSNGIWVLSQSDLTNPTIRRVLTLAEFIHKAIKKNFDSSSYTQPRIKAIKQDLLKHRNSEYIFESDVTLPFEINIKLPKKDEKCILLDVITGEDISDCFASILFNKKELKLPLLTFVKTSYLNT